MTDRIPKLATALGDRYRIERELGAGGMATVYLAHDLRHQRPVAIKVLRPELARSLAGERFLREIAVTARLNHPHILALLDSGSASDGEILFYVMPVATGQSLRDRLAASGVLPEADALRIAGDVAEALVHAHAHGVVHRDIKPDNILLSEGHAIVVDFGIAKAVGAAREDAALTSEGMSLGTPAYMAPEQAAGESDVDHRADMYAIGAVLYEMLTGTLPFSGSFQQVVAAKLAKDAPSLSARAPKATPALVRLVARCLARDPAQRPATADALLAELRALARPEPGGQRRLTRSMAVTTVLALAVAAVITVLFVRDRRAGWVRETALPEIARLMEADQLDSAFALAERAEARAPGDSALANVWREIALTQTFLSEPVGATVTRAAVNDTTRWIPVGTTPTAPVRIPRNAWFYRYALPGYRPVTIMGARLGGSYAPIPSPVPMQKASDPDSGMVLLRGAGLVGTLYEISSASAAVDLPDFLMDKLEVTNREYKAFVDAGGYADPRWWDSTIVRDGRPIAWREAMALLTDETGRPGPAGWEGSAPKPGTEELPVGGVSWYEARAYARFVGKALPTVLEWNAAAIPEAARWVVPNGRYNADGPVKGGAAGGVSPRGVYDLAGNAREWAVNAREAGTRFILGGGWSDPAYLFSEAYTAPEFDRSAINGIRLVRRLGDSPALARAMALIPRRARDVVHATPVDDATFRGFLALYDYDRTPLNGQVTARDSTNPDWVREDVAFDLPGSTRMAAVLFLPKRVAPPYQTIVVWPASDAFLLRDPRRLSMSYADFIIRSGRAVVYPIYEHTYGRGTSQSGDDPSPTIEHRDQMLRWATEMRRSIDYAVTRPDIDTTRLAYVGTSWGSRIGGTMLALEPRFRTAILNVPGFNPAPVRPEEDPVNFLPRIRIPVLMLSGRYDSVFPYESSQVPFFRLLGSPPGAKKQVMFEGGHFLPRPLWVAETTKWLDEQLGVVTRR